MSATYSIISMPDYSLCCNNNAKTDKINLNVFKAVSLLLCVYYCSSILNHISWCAIMNNNIACDSAMQTLKLFMHTSMLCFVPSCIMR